MAVGSHFRSQQQQDVVVRLSPWPTDPSAREAAIAALRAAVGGRTADSDEAANHLGIVAAAKVEQYAPRAPQAIKDEAVIRFAGYLAGSDYGGIVRESGLPGHDVEYAVNHANAWRNSGAAMLLTTWRVRRAGAIG